MSSMVVKSKNGVVRIWKSAPAKLQRWYFAMTLALTAFILNLGHSFAQTPVPPTSGMTQMQGEVTGLMDGISSVIIVIIVAGISVAAVAAIGIGGFRLARRVMGF